LINQEILYMTRMNIQKKREKMNDIIRYQATNTEHLYIEDSQ